MTELASNISFRNIGGPRNISFCNDRNLNAIQNRSDIGGRKNISFRHVGGRKNISFCNGGNLNAVRNGSEVGTISAMVKT